MFRNYQGATAALATMHGKETAIAPAMRAYLGLTLVTPPALDTDRLGTFTGETPRIGTMRDVAIRKARLGMQASGLSVGIASEGSFGPHPSIPFFRAGMELMVLVDDQQKIIISESLIDAEANYDEVAVTSMSELDEFMPRLKFPTHALVVRPNQTASPWWRLHPELARAQKGIVSYEELAEAVTRASRMSEDGSARVITDMRAHLNPTRMRSIASLAAILARRIAAECPACGAPGFGKVAPAPGLACLQCGEETITPRGDILRCGACPYEREERRLPIQDLAEPGECPRCNP